MSGTETYKINIYIGLREGYDGDTHSIEEAIDVCSKFVDELGLCVTVTPTNYVYSGGYEPGIIVGLINYPRYPKTKDVLNRYGVDLAEKLMKHFKQNRCTFETPKISMLMENGEFDSI